MSIASLFARAVFSKLPQFAIAIGIGRFVLARKNQPNLHKAFHYYRG
jgi:hypothetical protein